MNIYTSIGMYRQETKYEGVYKYVAPDGYEFWSCGSKYGNVIWGGKYLDNVYYLKKKDDNG